MVLALIVTLIAIGSVALVGVLGYWMDKSAEPQAASKAEGKGA